MAEKKVYNVYYDVCDGDPSNVVETHFVGGYTSYAEAWTFVDEANSQNSIVWGGAPYFALYYIVEG